MLKTYVFIDLAQWHQYKPLNMKLLPILLSTFLLLSCVKSAPLMRSCPNWNATSLALSSRISSEKALNSKTAKEQGLAARKGILWAEKCVQSFPKEAGCYFYRAVNTGLLLEVDPFHFQKKLKGMIGDCEKVISLNENYDQGGAYRILGNIYLKAPSFSLKPKGIVKDLEKGAEFAKKGLGIDKNHRGNRQLWAEILFEEERYEEAYPLLQSLAKEYESLKKLNRENQKNYDLLLKLMFKAKKLTKLTKKLTNSR